MNGDSKVSTKSKIIVTALAAALGVLAIVLAVIFSPDPMVVDWNEVQYIPSNVTLLAADAENNPTGNVALVRYNEDGSIDDSDWKVLQFTDMHLTQEDDRNAVTIRSFIETLKREKPDFVVLTGDIITRPGGRPRAVQLAEIFEKMNVYWCACLGNHEGDSMPFTLSREENIEIWSKYPHCLVENDVKKTSDGTEVWGLGNTVVNLLGANNKVAQSMIFMDSGDKVSSAELNYLKEQGYEVINDKAEYAERTEKGEKVVKDWSYDFLKPSQLKWFSEQVNAVTNNLTNGVKTMLFIHIPLVEQSYVKLIEKETLEEKGMPSGWDYAYGGDHSPVMKGETIYGYMILKEGWSLVGDTASYEKCYCSDYNSGMYELMKSMRKGVNALFCGHDHVSNSILYESALAGEDPVYLCYGVCSGLQSYNLYSLGISDTDDYSLRGYGVITVKADSSFDYQNVRYNDVEHKIARIIGGIACD